MKKKKNKPKKKIKNKKSKKPNTPKRRRRATAAGDESYWSARLVINVLGFILAVLPLIFDVKTYDQFEFIKTLALRVGIAVLLVTVTLDVYLRGLPRRWPLWWAPVTFLSVSFVSLVFSTSPFTSWNGEYESWTGVSNLILYVLIFIISATWVDSLAAVRRLSYWLIAGTTVLTIVALTYKLGYDFPSLFGYVSPLLDPDRIGATLGNPNFLAAVMGMYFPLMVILVLRWKGMAQVLGFALLAGMALAVAFTGSRAGYAVCLTLIPLAWILNRVWQGRRQPHKMSKLVWIFLFVVIVATLFFAGKQWKSLGDSLVHPVQTLTERRFMLWQPAWEIFKEHPVLGSGPDTYMINAIRYFKPVIYHYHGLGEDINPVTSENIYLDLTAMSGILGLTVWLTMVTVVLRRAWMVCRLGDNLGGHYARSFSLGVIAILGTWTFNFPVVVTYSLFMCFLGLLAAAPYWGEPEAGRREKLNPGARKIAVAMVLLALVLLVGVVREAGRRRAADAAFMAGNTMIEKQREYEGVLQPLEEAVKIRPRDPRYLFLLAQFEYLVALDNYQGEAQKRLAEKSFRHFQSALELQPTNPYLMSYLGRTLELLGRHGEALKWLLQGVENGPAVRRFREMLIEFYAKQGQFPSALEHLGIVLRDYPQRSFGLGLDTARLMLENKDFVSAEKALDLCILAQPQRPEAYSNLALVYMAQGRLKAARRLLNQSLSKDPQFMPAIKLQQQVEGGIPTVAEP